MVYTRVVRLAVTGRDNREALTQARRWRGAAESNRRGRIIYPPRCSEHRARTNGRYPPRNNGAVIHLTAPLLYQG